MTPKPAAAAVDASHPPSQNANAYHQDDVVVVYEHGVPVIDLSNPNETDLIEQVALACSTFGFFQVTNHGIPPGLLEQFRRQSELYFDLPYDQKKQWKRHECNARGYFDDELTKQRRDWKECLDVGVPGSRDWTLRDEDPRNECLDGLNQFPSPNELLPEFRNVVIDYFEACATLSDRIAGLMAKGLLVVDKLLVERKNDEECHHNDAPTSSDSTLEASALDFLETLRNNHTSYLRLNYYPPCPPQRTTDLPPSQAPPLGISPHKDAGFLTVLAQDQECHSLEVARHEPGVDDNDDSSMVDFDRLDWVTVQPVEGALTINTGDMAMIWSNGRYRAPLHRVRTDPIQRRYSAPFFYNPGYDTLVSPMSVGHIRKDNRRYHACLWGYFRAVRFAGDLTDLGVEIQASDYRVKDESSSSMSPHLKKQQIFSQEADFQQPFSVERYRPLLVMEQADESS